MDTGLIIALSAAVGILVGAAATHFLLPRPDDRKTADLRKEFDAYREEVADHFAKTAHLVNQLTESYKGVFEHLQDGAHDLLSEEQLRDRLADESGETITLTRLGYKKADAPQPDADPETDEEPGEAEPPVDYPRAERDDS